jgi:hypothetical protein
MMEKYENSGGNSGVSSFEIGSNYIIVLFKGKLKPYRYSYTGGAGRYHVENLKRLARNGSGLNAYIINYVKDKCDK